MTNFSRPQEKLFIVFPQLVKKLEIKSIFLSSPKLEEKVSRQTFIQSCEGCLKTLQESFSHKKKVVLWLCPIDLCSSMLCCWLNFRARKKGQTFLSIKKWKSLRSFSWFSIQSKAKNKSFDVFVAGGFRFSRRLSRLTHIWVCFKACLNK